VLLAHACNLTYSAGRGQEDTANSSVRPYLKKKTLHKKKKTSQKRAGRVTYGIGPEFKPQCHKKYK
jgi:hypothetical protein